MAESLSARETAAEHIRNALTIGCADEAALTRRLRAALQEIEAGNMKNPVRYLFTIGPQHLKRSPKQLRDAIGRVQAIDIGKRVYDAGDGVWQVENEEQVRRRLGKNPKRRTVSKGARALMGRRNPAARVPGRSSPTRLGQWGRSELEAWDAVAGQARRIVRTARNAGVIQDAQNILTIAAQMAAQVRSGVHENPTLAVLGNPRGVRVLTTHTYGGAIRYRHQQDGKDYRHAFGAGSKILLLPDGSIQIKHPTRRLWEDL